MKCKNWNRGTDAEIRAKKDLEKIYWYVKNTKHKDYYDYLVRFGLTDIKIEVKYLELKHPSTRLKIRWGQFINLLNGGKFMIYLMTNKGNGFLKAEDLIRGGHIHFNEINPHEKHFLWIIGIENGKFIYKEPSYCESKLCHGSIKKWLDEGMMFKIPKTLEITECYDCPHRAFAHEYYYCALLRIKSFVEAHKDGEIRDDCPLPMLPEKEVI